MCSRLLFPHSGAFEYRPLIPSALQLYVFWTKLKLILSRIWCFFPLLRIWNNESPMSSGQLITVPRQGRESPLGLSVNEDEAEPSKQHWLIEYWSGKLSWLLPSQNLLEGCPTWKPDTRETRKARQGCSGAERLPGTCCSPLQLAGSLSVLPESLPHTKQELMSPISEE